MLIPKIIKIRISVPTIPDIKSTLFMLWQPTVVHKQWQDWGARTHLKFRICSGALPQKCPRCKKQFSKTMQKLCTMPAIAYVLCCTVPHLHTLNHTDASALVVCRHVWHWHWGRLSEDLNFSCYYVPFVIFYSVLKLFIG
jgi:hypothetical protein